METPLTLERGEWSEYFRSLARESRHLLATVGFPNAEPDHRDGPPRPLQSIRYDPSADEVEVVVAIGGRPRATLRYFISAPRSITVEELGTVKAVCIADAIGSRTLVCLSDVFGRPDTREAPLES
jgi:hypothetical protein